MNGHYSTLAEFWPFYVSEHLNPTNRKLHFAGTTLALILALMAFFLKARSLAVCALITPYAFAWTGHFGFEKNRPATFKYPLLSLRADFKMYALTWRGAMDAEIVRLSSELRRLRKS